MKHEVSKVTWQCYFWTLVTSQRVPMTCHVIFDLIGQDLVNRKVVSSNPNTPIVI